MVYICAFMRRKQGNKNLKMELDEIFGSESAGNSLSSIILNLQNENMTVDVEPESPMPAIVNLQHGSQAAQIEAVVIDLTQSQLNADKPNYQWLETPGCRCQNSKCMKSYCKCFSTKKYCRSTCNCKGCQNSELKHDHNKRVVPVRTKQGCSCKNKSCLKKYCYCIQNGRKCSKHCTCINCCNQVQQ